VSEALVTAERDPFEARFARQASGLLREFNEAGVIDAADVHVARELGRLSGESDDAVLLAAALAVRGPRLGHVHVDLGQIRDTAAVDAEEPVDLATLAWPEPGAWIVRVGASALVAAGDLANPDPAHPRPLRLVGSWLYLDRYWAEEVQVARALRGLGAETVSGVNTGLLDDGLARLFAAVFELPFQRHRGWIALRQAMSARLWQLRRTEPGVVAGHLRGASRASGPRNQAGGRYRPARPRPVAGRARPASQPGPPAPPGPGDSAARSGSC